MDNISLVKLSGLPESFANALLVFSFVLVLVPYCSGKDFGVFKVPDFSAPAKRALRYVSPVLLLVTVFAFVPIFSPIKNADEAKAYSEKGFDSLKWGQLIEAQYMFQKAADLEPDIRKRSDWYYNAGLTAERQGKLVDAELLYRESLKLRPWDPQRNAAVGNILFRQKRWEKSEKYLRDALATGTKWPLWGTITHEELEGKLKEVPTTREELESKLSEVRSHLASP